MVSARAGCSANCTHDDPGAFQAHARDVMGETDDEEEAS